MTRPPSSGQPTTPRSRAVRAAGLLVAALASPVSASADANAFTAGPGPASKLQVHVLKKGLLSGLAHDHHFLAQTWRATVHLDPAGGGPVQVDATIALGSLEDQQPALSKDDKAKVQAQALGPDQLDVARFPEARFTAAAPLKGSLNLAPPPAGAAAADRMAGTLSGTLALHGRERPLDLAVSATREGTAWRVHATGRFKQSDLGITPFSGFLGTIAVHDEVEVELELLLQSSP